MDRVIFKPKSNVQDHSKAIMEALEECRGKASLVLEKGTYFTGPIAIPSGSHLILEEGAVLSFIPDPSLYPPVETWWEGVPCWAMHPCLFINEAENVVVEGEGKLLGNGKFWWDYVRAWKRSGKKPVPESPIEMVFASLNPGYENQPGGGGGRPKQFLRPSLLQIRKSRNVTVKGITLTESPFWTLHPLLSDDVRVENVTVINPSDSPNTDGIDIEMCHGVRVKGCTVDVGDDGIAVKSGSGALARAKGRCAKDITIENCTVRHSHGGVVIGSETANGIDGVTVRDCIFDGADRGIRIKTRRGRGGKIRGINASNIEIRDCICPLTINMYYKCGDPDPSAFSRECQPITDLTPEISDISVSGLSVSNARGAAAFIVGLPEAPIRNVTISDCDIQLTEEIHEGLEIEMCRGIEMTGYRGIRVINSEVDVRNVKVNVEPQISRE